MLCSATTESDPAKRAAACAEPSLGEGRTTDRELAGRHAQSGLQRNVEPSLL
jgi:hypothetical protein